MYLFHLFRSFLPNLNPIGFSATDFIEIFVALVFVLLALCFAVIESSNTAAVLAQKTGWCMLFLGLLPIALRLALVPQISNSGAECCRRFQLYPDRRHAPPFPPGESAASRCTSSSRHSSCCRSPPTLQFFRSGKAWRMALGWTIFGHPWAGVALSIGALCALCYWMLRGWITPGWALIGGLLAAIEFGPLNQWMNSYWGGAVSGCAGCLVFGALPRLRESARRAMPRCSGSGSALQLLTRPFESIFLLLSVVLFFLARFAPSDAARGCGVTGGSSRDRTHPASEQTGDGQLDHASLSTQPLSIRRAHHIHYSAESHAASSRSPASSNSITKCSRKLTAQAPIHSRAIGRAGQAVSGSIVSFCSRRYIWRCLRFFSLCANIAIAWVAITILIFSLGTNFYPYFYPHYIAALTCLFVLISVTGLRKPQPWTVRGSAVGDRMRSQSCCFFALRISLSGTDCIFREARICSRRLRHTNRRMPSTTAIREAASRSETLSKPRPASRWYSCAIGRGTNFRNGFTTRPTLMTRGSFGRAIWARKRIRNFCAIIRSGRYGCWSRMRVRHV